MKKLFAILLGLVLVVSLAGCKNDNIQDNENFSLASQNGAEYKVEYLKVENFDENKIYFIVKDNKFVGMKVEFDTSKYSFKEARFVIGSFNAEYDLDKAKNGEFTLTNAINLVIEKDGVKSANEKNIKFTPVLSKIGEDSTIKYELTVKMQDLTEFLKIEH